MEPSKPCIQPRTEPGIPQFSLPVLQMKNKALMIMLESEPTLSKSYQMVFEGALRTTLENKW